MATAATKTNPALEAAEARITGLEARIKELKRIELSTTVWVNDRITTDRTRSDKLKVTFSGQKSVKTADGGRVYGQYHNFVAYGEMAEHFQALIGAGERLLHITAFESPWTNGARKSDWVVISIAPFERPEAGQTGEGAAAPYSQDPSDEEVSF